MPHTVKFYQEFRFWRVQVKETLRLVLFSFCVFNTMIPYTWEKEVRYIPNFRKE